MDRAGTPSNATAGGNTAVQRDAELGARLLSTWTRLSKRRGGAWLFSRLLGRLVPYSGTVKPQVISLEPGRAVLRMADRRGVRNHLRSVHAIALANLGELASGLAAAAAMPAGVRGIPVRITIDYRRKARGTLTAIGSASIPAVHDVAECDVEAVISDASGESVAVVQVHWTLERVS